MTDRLVTHCPHCQSQASVPHIRVGDRLALAPTERFTIARCASCGLLRLNPRPTDEALADFYPPTYAPFQVSPRSSSWLGRWMEQRYTSKRVRAVAQRWSTPGRALDVGCATGLFLSALREAGWDVFGVEPNAQAAAQARSRSAIPVHEGTLDDAPFQDASFEVITLWHVLEHLPDPARALARVWALLVPGGLVALTVPNATGWDARLWGEWWAGWDAPRHLTHFAPATLRAMLARAGFDDIQCSSFTDRLGMWRLSAQFWVSATPHALWRAAIRRALVLPGSAILTYPYFRLAEQFDQSSAVTFFARRS